MGNARAGHAVVHCFAAVEGSERVLSGLQLKYNPALDGLRAVAIVLVFLSHAHVPMFDGAFFGVDLFFVLSGFLITSLLLKELHQSGRLDYWRFYQRRFLRLMPALLLFLAAYWLFAPLIWPDLDDVNQDVVVSALYLADYGIAFFDSPNTLLHMWSLSVEEHFYLVWPLLLWLIVRRTPRGQVWCRIFGLFLLAWAWRVYWVAQDQQFYEIFFRFDTRATGLLAGSLLAALVMERPAWFERARKQIHHGLWLVLLVPVLMALDWDDMNVMTWAMTVVELAAVVVLIAVLPRTGPVYAMLTQPGLVKLGQISYGVYLWHYPVYRVLRAHMDWPLVVVLGSLISVMLATLSFITIERWALGMRDRKPAQNWGLHKSA